MIHKIKQCRTYLADDLDGMISKSCNKKFIDGVVMKYGSWEEYTHVVYIDLYFRSF